jgi:UDP-4-amino-4,6-dideoxy-N-acetyl-beta-L-altrosamine transaminase
VIPYGRQHISQEDIEAVVGVLQSDFLTQGPAVPQLEKELADYCGVAHCCLVNSATSALHMACLALDVGHGDLVWTTPISFVATSNAALMCGADVDFVDVDSATLNMSVDALRIKLEEAARLGRLPKVVIPVHMGGQSANMAAIFALGQEYGFRIIEDASHAVGGSYGDLKVGSCAFSDVVIFSFHPVKIITTGEGGALTTKDDEIARRLKLLRSHGVTKDSTSLENQDEGPWYYEQHCLGYNYRMTDIHAALGLSQLQRLDAYVTRRNQIASRYIQSLPEQVTPLTVTSGCYSSYHLFIIRVKPKVRRALFEYLRAKEIWVQIHYYPIHLQPYYRDLGFKAGLCPVAEATYEEIISLPMYPTLRDEQHAYVIDMIREFYES